MLRGQCCVVTRKSVASGLCLLALALTSCHRTLASPIRDDDPLKSYSDQVRLQHLYADNEHSYLHLQITPEGEVSGTQEINKNSVLQITSVRQGIVVIRGMKTTLYLCMDSKHRLYGSRTYKEDDCDFREVPLADGYCWYYSEKYPAPLTLTPARGRKMVRFMPLKNTIPIDSLHVEHQTEGYINEYDPFGMKNYDSIASLSQDKQSAEVSD